ncbi:MAG: flippase-like domain-containing protein [Bacteroidetes bacterium]|nr:flippase-like domain-containing protein [Bacteroidota bacterium]
MNAKVKSILQFILFVAIGAGLVWLSIHNIPESDIEATKQSFKNADYTFVSLSVAISMLAHVLRAWRWNLLMEPLGHRISFKNSFAAVMVGYVVNYAVPRAGELSRCGIAAKYEKIPFAAALGTVITERIVDVLLLLFLFCITLAVQFKELIGLTNLYVLHPLTSKLSGLCENKLYIIAFVTAIFILIGILWILKNKIKALLSGKIGGLLKNFSEGLQSVKKLKKPYLFIFQSLLIWFFYFLSLYLCFYCFSATATLGVKTALSVLLFGTLGVMISPGGVGAYQLICTQVLVFYGVINSVAIAFPWITWGSQLIAILIIGGLCFLLLPILNKNNNDKLSGNYNT